MSRRVRIATYSDTKNPWLWWIETEDRWLLGFVTRTDRLCPCCYKPFVDRQGLRVDTPYTCHSCGAQVHYTCRRSGYGTRGVCDNCRETD